MTELATIFRRPFRQQVAAFRLRMGNLVPTSRWDDISKAQHDRAFMVAGATKADLLADLAQAVDKAIASGTGLEEFRRDFRRIVEDRGWHGWTGEGTRAGEAWRTRVIYQTNMRTSYMAGRLAQLREAGFPYWVYRHGGSADPREWHLAWDGLVLPADHPFWTTHFPPNGWGCSCYVLGAWSREAARFLGGDPDKVLPAGWENRDPRTGEPKGIGRGWGYAPGASVSDAVAALAPKLDRLPERPAMDLIQSWLTESLFGRWLANPDVPWPMARLPQARAEELGSKSTVAMMSPETAAKQLRLHPELTVFDYAQAQRVIDEATEVIFDGLNTILFVFAPDGIGGHVLVVEAVRTGDQLFLTSFRRLTGTPEERRRILDRLRRRNT